MNMDPNKIRVHTRGYESIRNLLDRLPTDDLAGVYLGLGVVTPSLLVEAAIVRMPMAPLVVDELHEGDKFVWRARLNAKVLAAVYAFRGEQMGGHFKLKGLRFVPQFEGMGWSDLPSHLQRRILECEIPLVVVEVGTPFAIREAILDTYRSQLG